MDRRPLQLAAALLLLVGLLGVSTALIAEMREEILSAPRPDEGPALTAPADHQGLPITEFTLLDPVDAELPAVEAAGNVLRVLEKGTLFLAAGDRIQIAPLGLPGRSTVDLPRGGAYRGSLLSCSVGCLVGGDAGRLTVPANASLLLPSGVRLPLRDGALAPGTVLDLPPGTRLFLAPLTMSGPTPVALWPTSTLVLPFAGALMPIPGAAVGEPNARLPANTIVRGPLRPPEDAPGVEDFLRRQDPLRSDPPSDLPSSGGPRPAIIEVTDVPDAIRKGRPFQVTGFVHRPDGSPSPGHPVTLYANATKEAPGFVIQVGEVLTGPDGTFEATCILDTARPAQPYHIVAEAHARLDVAPRLLGAWSDPIVDVAAEPRLVLELPEVEGVQVPIALQARLEDEHAAPVPGQPIVFLIEGTSHRFEALTDANGEVIVVHETGFPFPGTWRVIARFDGATELSPAEARATIEIIEARLFTDPTLVAPRGGPATLSGMLIVDGQPPAGTRVKAAVATIKADTPVREDGSFELTLDVPSDLPVGNYTLALETDKVFAHRSVVLTVTGRTMLSAAPPSVLPLGGTLPLSVVATDELGAALAGAEVVATTPGGAQSRGLTNEHGEVVLGVPLASLGHWNVTLAARGTSLLAPASARVHLHVGPLSVEGAPRLTPGVNSNVTLVLSINRRPLVGETLALEGPGFVATSRSDDAGRVTFIAQPAFGLDPGPTELALELQRYNMLEHLDATVLEKPELRLDVLVAGRGGEPIVLRVVAVGDSGFLGGVPLVIDASGAFDAHVRAVTAADGGAVVELDRPRGAQGLELIKVVAEETGTTGRAVQVASADVSPAPFPWWVLAPVAPVAAGIYAYRRAKRRAPHVAPPGPSLVLSIAPQAEGLPPVWHAGEATVLHVRLLDEARRPIPDARLDLAGPHGAATIRLDEVGAASVAVPASDAPRLTYRARFGGFGAHRATEASLDVRLVDYREEIDGEYRALCERATTAGLAGKDSTPREIAKAFGDSADARRLAVLFERCDYSPYPVDRSHYVTFMKAKEACLVRAGIGASG